MRSTFNRAGYSFNAERVSYKLYRTVGVLAPKYVNAGSGCCGLRPAACASILFAKEMSMFECQRGVMCAASLWG